eukprot:6209037-Pleurochrysis_carterae.AAC.3
MATYRAFCDEYPIAARGYSATLNARTPLHARSCLRNNARPRMHARLVRLAVADAPVAQHAHQDARVERLLLHPGGAPPTPARAAGGLENSCPELIPHPNLNSSEPTSDPSLSSPRPVP